MATSLGEKLWLKNDLLPLVHADSLNVCVYIYIYIYIYTHTHTIVH